MAKRFTASAIAVSLSAIVGLGAAFPTGDAGYDLRSLVLSATGTAKVKPGQVRTPIFVDGVEYEIVGAALGAPKVVPLDH